MGIILIFTDQEYDEFHQTLSFKGEKIKVYPFNKAPDIVRDCQVDIILLDCIDVDAGLKLLKENKTTCPNIPNIFLTDVSYEGLVLKAFRAGARDFFKKPVNVQELQNTVQGLLTVKKASREKRLPFLKSSS
jgi:DNA-binding response OmpR family regulator